MKFFAVFVLACLATAASAAPVTLRFEASISTVVDRRAETGPPPPLLIGDKVVGEFTFQPRDVNLPLLSEEGSFLPQYTYDILEQSQGLSLSFGDTTLKAGRYEIHSIDNQPVIDGPPDLTSDFLSVQNVFGWEPNPDLTAKGFLPAAFLLKFSGGPIQHFDGAGIPADRSVWEGFEAKSFALRFSPVEGSGVYSAYGSFVLLNEVPEPSGSFIVVLGVCLFSPVFQREGAKPLSVQGKRGYSCVV